MCPRQMPAGQILAGSAAGTGPGKGVAVTSAMRARVAMELKWENCIVSDDD